MNILHIDIENSPHEGYTWGTWEQNVIEVTQESHLLSVAWKWEHEKTVQVRSLRMYKTFKKDPRDDYLLTQEIHGLLSRADIVVAHNGKGHDIPFLNYRFMVHKMKAPRPYKVVDTLSVMRSLVKSKSPSNSLNNLSQRLGYGQKVKHEGFPLWKACINKDIKAYKKMEKYNKQDVVLLQKLYHDLRGWMPTHPLSYSGAMCEVCDSNRIFWRGTMRSKKKLWRRFQCQDCGSWGKKDDTI